MFRFRKSILVSALALLLTTIFGAAASAATYFYVPWGGTISPGGRVCTLPQRADSYVDIQGNANPGVRFLVVWGPSASNVNQEIWRSPSDFTTATNASFRPWTFPGTFPGYFKLCARNVNTGSATVNMYITGQ